MLAKMIVAGKKIGRKIADKMSLKPIGKEGPSKEVLDWYKKKKQMEVETQLRRQK
jgi:hypothetical protein